MKATILISWVIYASSALCAEAEKPKAPQDLQRLAIDLVRALVRDSAKIIEGRYAGIHDDVQGLAQRVDDILALPEKTQAKSDDSPRSKLKAAMVQTLVSISVGNNAVGNGFCGYELDTGDAARRHRLRTLAGTVASGVQEWEREAELYDLSNQLGLKNEMAQHLSRLVSLGRAYIEAHPEDGEGHAMLADSLMSQEDLAGAEAAAQQALRLQKDNLRGRLVLLQVECLRWLNRASDLKNKDELFNKRAFLDRLVKTPMPDEEFSRFDAEGKKIVEQANALMEEASGDLVLMLRSAGLRVWVLTKIKQAEISRKAETPKNIHAVNVLSITEAPVIFPNQSHIEVALRLADKNIEAYGSIFLSWLKGAFTRFFDSGNAAQGGKGAAAVTVHRTDTLDGTHKDSKFGAKLDIGAEKLKALEGSLTHLQEWLKTAKGIEKARVHEVIYRAEMLGLFGSRFHLDALNLTEGLRADPERFGLWSLLLFENEGSWNDDRLGAAIMELQLALDPTIQQRKYCTAATGKLKLWQRANALMERNLKEAPDDYLLWNQKAVLSLRQDSSDEGLKKAEALFEKGKDAMRRKQPALGADRLLFVKNCILFEAMQGRWQEALETAESYQKNKFMPEDDAARLLKTLRESKPVK